MSNLYPKWKEALLQASADSALTGTVKAVLTSQAYSASHQYYSSLTSIATTTAGGGPATITIGPTKTYTDGYFDTSDDTDTFTQVSGAGGAVTALVIYIENGGANTTWRLVAYIDGFASVTPNGGDITIDWSDAGDGFDGIFRL